MNVNTIGKQKTKTTIVGKSKDCMARKLKIKNHNKGNVEDNKKYVEDRKIVVEEYF